MYRLIGRYDGELEPLLNLVSRLSPSKGGTGYTCTPPPATAELYRPLLAAVFPGDWTRSFLAVIWPNGSIMPHAKDGEVIADGSIRYHLVLKTNEHCWSMHDGGWQQLEEGRIYEFDPRLVHASINWGSAWRIHFVVDIDGGMIASGRAPMT